MKALALLLMVGACAATPVEDIGIACASDGDCPDGTWCDLRYNDNTCLSLDDSGPPHIAYDGFVLGEQVVTTISVPSKTFTLHEFRLRNDGRSQTYVTVDVTGPACLDASSHVRSDGVLLDEGEHFDADFGVDPLVGCPSPATIAIAATASKRTFTFMATVTISQ